MSDIWMNFGLQSQLKSYTGHSVPDPWNLEEGLMGMALYLKDKGGGKKSGEYEAAARYYCGGNWKRTVCYNYADTVTSWANGGYDEFF